MTVDIAAVAARADTIWRNPNHPASVAYDVAKVWEQAARDLAAERDALVAPSTSDSPRTWTLPAEPEPEVSAVRCARGWLWRRGQMGRLWRGPKDSFTPAGIARNWTELLVGFGPLTDATAEVQP